MKKTQHLSINPAHPSVHSPPSKNALTQALRIPQSKFTSSNVYATKKRKKSKRNLKQNIRRDRLGTRNSSTFLLLEEGNRKLTHLQPKQRDIGICILLLHPNPNISSPTSLTPSEVRKKPPKDPQNQIMREQLPHCLPANKIKAKVGKKNASCLHKRYNCFTFFLLNFAIISALPKLSQTYMNLVKGEPTTDMIKKKPPPQKRNKS